MNQYALTLLKHYETWHFERAAEKLDISISGNVTSNSSEAIREMVLVELGISLSSE